MANRGENKTQKRISAPKVRGLLRKASIFTPKSRPGPHSAKTSVPLSFALITVLKAVDNMKEAGKIISEGKVFVNGKPRKNTNFPVGIFDVVELTVPKTKYRFLLDTKGRIDASEIDYKGGNFKISKVTGKKTVKGKKTWITTSDGFTIDAEKHKINVGDSVKISFPENKIEEVFPMEKGNVAFVVSGVHTGMFVKIEGATKGSIKTTAIVEISNKGKKFQTRFDSVVVVGKEKSEIEAIK